MIGLKRCIYFFQNLWVCRRAVTTIKTTLEFCWNAYTKPKPDSCTEGLTLLLLCFIIAVATGGLFFQWLSKTLQYGLCASSVTTWIYSTAIFLVLSLVHPARCVFTVILPCLGTKKGRRLIISTSIMLLVLNVIPNIARNVNVIARILRCTSVALTESLINSSQLVNEAKEELIQRIIQARKNEITFVKSLTHFDTRTRINVSEVQQQFNLVSQKIEGDFSWVKMLVEETLLQANRLLAAMFVICLVTSSTWYLKAYLTDVRFDNVYITRQLERLARRNGIEILPGDAKKLISSRGCRMSQQEFLRCVPYLLVITSYLILTLVVIAVDHMVFHFIVAGGLWLSGDPYVTATIDVKYTVRRITPICSLFHSSCDEEILRHQKPYHWSFNLVPGRCVIEPSKPDSGVVLQLGLLYLMAYILVVFEVYIRRVRRRVSASFFKRQEERRIVFLYRKIVAKQEKKRTGVFFVKVSEGKA
uniref:Osteoclast stimulatory transmembrane protein n=1 Tax=Lepisosteus oculatus TaxID=7918 RepID=W5M208_LEPOC|nr:PREDICTED: osteoclast stimulatory transmembrane protein-like [Lepisosteus oculatus]